MYNIIRFTISMVLFFGMLAFVRKSRFKEKKWAYRVCSILGIFFFVLLGFIPVENIVGPIDSIEVVYEYRNPGAKVRLIIEGEESAYVSGVENGKEVIMFVPRAKDGWYVGNGTESIIVASSFPNTIDVSVYNFKGTNDYYIVAYDLYGSEIEIVDSCNSEFIPLEKTRDSGITYSVYYAYVPEYDENYWISVNGEKIELRQE